MKFQKQKFRHDPASGLYGDCHRTAIACILDLDASDVPHFMHPDVSATGDAAHIAAEAWLNERGLTQINMLFDGKCSVDDILSTVKNVNPHARGTCFILGGQSRNGCNHSVVCCDGEIVCDPSIDNSGIIGPCDDGWYWLTFFGGLEAVHLPARAKARADVD